MCQPNVIKQSITRLSKRTFARRLDVSNGDTAGESTALKRLNADLEHLYNLLYESYPTISADDYIRFGKVMSILLETLEQLSRAYRTSGLDREIGADYEAFESHVSLLKEIDSDIRSFRVLAQSNPRLQTLLTRLKSLA